MPTLAELRAQSGPKPLPRGQKTVTLVEGQHLLDDARRLNEEREDLQTASQPAVDEDGNRTGPPAKAGAGAKEARARAKRIEEIPGEMAAIVARLGDHQGVVSLTGISGGDWQRFKDQHPPRQDVESVADDGTTTYRLNASDLHFARGVCNSSALFEALGRFVSKWDGEDVAEGDWDSWLAERITYADRRDLVTDVVMLHEQVLNRAPKSQRSSSTTES